MAAKDTFLGSFADMITLLLVFFIYLYSISDVDLSKFIEAKHSLSKTFSRKTALQEIVEYEEEQRKLDEIQKVIADYVQDNDIPYSFTVKKMMKHLTIDLGSEFLFITGSTQIREEIKPLLNSLSDVLGRVKGKFSIEGHPDDMPIRTPQYPSNWELSSARSAAVCRYLIDTGMKAPRFSIRGFSYYQPLYPNSNSENRSRNRRIVILVEPTESSE